jgi:signal transduction histidine kinase
MDTIRTKFKFPVEITEKGKTALKKIEAAPWQYDVVVIYDDCNEKSGNLDALKKIKKNYPALEVIYIVASREKTDNAALHEGAFGCFFLPLSYEGIAYGVKFAREKAQFWRERKMLDKHVELLATIMPIQYVLGMIHELASIAHKGKASATYIRGSNEFRKIGNRNWKIEMSKIEATFDEICTFATQAFKIKDMAKMKFIRALEYRSINNSIRDAIHELNFEARKKFARIDWKFDKAHDKRHAYFDEILIKQAIRNLIANSLKWISASGVGEITITSGEKGDFIFIRVEDNGQGIKKEIEKSIFEPFFTTSSMGGGISLFFVWIVVKMHEGEVRLLRRKDPTIFEIKISNKLKKGGKSV